ncbi:hypothetical protein CR513_18729, partial [Mucuna pruriens]
MCPTLQELETESTKSVGALGGGHQYGRQQPYHLNPIQAQHIAPRSGPVGTMPGPSQANYQQQGPRYQASPFRQQPHQQIPLQENNPTMEDLILQFQQNKTMTIHDLKI